MLTIRRSKDRGHAQLDWLDSFHTFSFSSYYDPAFMGFRDLRVINEDKIAPARGFQTHPHKDMEIITYVISGELAHKDTLGNETRIRPGEVQRMSAGTGIQHSEFNARSDSETHLLQIWILPSAKNLAPGYGQKSFAKAFAEKPLTLTVSPDGRDGSITMNQNAELWVAKWAGPRSLDWKIADYRYAWVQVVSGSLEVNDQTLQAGDGLAVAEEPVLRLGASSPVEFLLFHLN